MTELLDIYDRVSTMGLSLRQMEPTVERKLGRVPTLMDWYLLITELKRRELTPMGLEMRHG